MIKDRKVIKPLISIDSETKSETTYLSESIKSVILKELDPEETKGFSIKLWKARIDKLKDVILLLKAKLNRFKTEQLFNTSVNPILDSWGIPYTTRTNDEGRSSTVVHSDILDCINTTLKNQMVNEVKSKSRTTSGVIDLIEQLYWEIAEQESASKYSWLITLFVYIARMILERVADMFLSFANGVGGWNFRILWFCIRLGVLFKAAIIRYLSYNILWVICLLEDLSAHNDTITNTYNNKTKVINRYFIKMGSIRDENFFPYWNQRSWPVNSANAGFKSGYSQIDGHLSSSIIVSGGCGNVNFYMGGFTPISPGKFITMMNKPMEKVDDTTICACVQNPNNILGAPVTKLNLTTKAKLIEFQELMNAGQEQSEEGMFYSNGQEFLDDGLNYIKNQEYTQESFSLFGISQMSSMFGTSAMMNLNNLERSLKNFDDILTNMMNGDYIDLANLISGDMPKPNRNIIESDLEVDREIMEELAFKKQTLLQMLVNQEVIIKSLKAKVKAAMQTNTRRADKFKSAVQKAENKLYNIDSELVSVQNAMDDLEQQMKTKIDNLTDTNLVKNEDSVKKTKAIKLAVVMISDLICCFFSLLLTFGMKQSNANNSEFIKSANALDFVVNPTESKLEKEPFYLALKMVVILLEMGFNGINMFVKAFNFAGIEGTFLFKLDFNWMKILESTIGLTSYLTVDGVIKQIERELFESMVKSPSAEKQVLEYAITLHEIEISVIENNILNVQLDHENYTNSNIELAEKKIAEEQQILLDVENIEKFTAELNNRMLKPPGYEDDLRTSITLLKEIIVERKKAITDILELISSNNDKLLELVKEEKELIITLDHQKNMIISSENRITSLSTPAHEVLEELQNILMKKQCLSVNFLLSEVFDILKKVHLGFMLYYKILEYTPNISLTGKLDVDSKNLSLTSFFMDMLRLCLKLAPFLFNYCRLSDDVDTYKKMADLLEILEQEGEINIEEIHFEQHLFTKYDYTIKIPMLGDEADIDAYDKQINEFYSTPDSYSAKFKYKTYSKEVKIFLDLIVQKELAKEEIKTTIVVESTPNISEELK